MPPGVEATARDGNLTLTGTVHFGTERTAAETAVSGLIGLRNVKDEIDINFDADPGDVTEHDAALDAAWMASGVYDVIDNLVISG